MDKQGFETKLTASLQKALGNSGIFPHGVELRNIVKDLMALMDEGENIADVAPIPEPTPETPPTPTTPVVPETPPEVVTPTAVQVPQEETQNV